MTRTPGEGLPPDLAKRSIVGLVLVLGALAAIWFGGAVFWLLCSAVALGMAWEWGGLTRLSRSQTRLVQFSLSVPLAIMSPFAAGPDFFAFGLLVGATAFAVVATRHPLGGLGVLYAGLPALGLVLIRQQQHGMAFALWALALVWACDIGAYFAGRAIGGAKLAPSISPNKTWAGLMGGVLAAAVFGTVMHHSAGLPWRLTLATPALAVLAQGGDLFESWLKRRVGVKDSGTLLPGHGGLLDRLDGLAPVAPVAAFLVMLPEVRGMWG